MRSRSFRQWAVRALLLVSALALVIGLFDYEPDPVCIQVVGADCPEGDAAGSWFLVSGLAFILGGGLALSGASVPARQAEPPVATEVGSQRGSSVHALALLVVLFVGAVAWSALAFNLIFSDNPPAAGALIAWSIGVAIALGGILAAHRAYATGDGMWLPWAWFALIVEVFIFFSWMVALASPYLS